VGNPRETGSFVNRSHGHPGRAARAKRPSSSACSCRRTGQQPPRRPSRCPPSPMRDRPGRSGPPNRLSWRSAKEGNHHHAPGFALAFSDRLSGNPVRPRRGASPPIFGGHGVPASWPAGGKKEGDIKPVKPSAMSLGWEIAIRLFVSPSSCGSILDAPDRFASRHSDSLTLIGELGH